eukprot:GHVQ01021962.1.p1 GENE.GHVQ01021962.1~~GHVQ01021962.1.p1  ORF type:complete len:705 (+),score=84.20 GHVQ01021962.1:679-2793(+)
MLDHLTMYACWRLAYGFLMKLAKVCCSIYRMFSVCCVALVMLNVWNMYQPELGIIENSFVCMVKLASSVGHGTSKALTEFYNSKRNSLIMEPVYLNEDLENFDRVRRTYNRKVSRFLYWSEEPISYFMTVDLSYKRMLLKSDDCSQDVENSDGVCSAQPQKILRDNWNSEQESATERGSVCDNRNAAHRFVSGSADLSYEQMYGSGCSQCLKPPSYEVSVCDDKERPCLCGHTPGAAISAHEGHGLMNGTAAATLDTRDSMSQSAESGEKRSYTELDSTQSHGFNVRFYMSIQPAVDKQGEGETERDWRLEGTKLAARWYDRFITGVSRMNQCVTRHSHTDKKIPHHGDTTQHFCSHRNLTSDGIDDIQVDMVTSKSVNSMVAQEVSTLPMDSKLVCGTSRSGAGGFNACADPPSTGASHATRVLSKMSGKEPDSKECLATDQTSRSPWQTREFAMSESDISVGVGEVDEQCSLAVYVHGGGWITLNNSVYDKVYRRQVNSLNRYAQTYHDNKIKKQTNHPCVVLAAIDYRLAPEYPFPHGLNDVTTAMRWIYANADSIGIDKTRISLIGDSAGGNLVSAALGVAINSTVAESNDALEGMNAHTEQRGYDNGLLPGDAVTQGNTGECHGEENPTREKCIQASNKSFGSSPLHSWVNGVVSVGLVYPSVCRGCATWSSIKYGDLFSVNLRSAAWFDLMVRGPDAL